MMRAADEYAHTFDRVPVHLVVCVELAALAIVDRGLDRPSIVGGASIYPFVQNILLGLRHEGLGASFTTLLTPAETQVRELLGFPDGIALAGHISVGFRADPWPKRLRRNAVRDSRLASGGASPGRKSGPRAHSHSSGGGILDFSRCCAASIRRPASSRDCTSPLRRAGGAPGPSAVASALRSAG